MIAALYRGQMSGLATVPAHDCLLSFIHVHVPNVAVLSAVCVAVTLVDRPAALVSMDCCCSNVSGDSPCAVRSVH